MCFFDNESSVLACVLIDQTGCAENSVCAIILKINLLELKTPEHLQKHHRSDKQYLKLQLTDQTHSVGKLMFECVHFENIDRILDL